MALSESQRFILALEPQRDRLYGRALSGTPSPAAAEAALIAAVRKVFSAGENGTAGEPAALVEAALPEAKGAANPGAAMPADTWARLAAAVQIEAAGTHGGRSLNPDHALLKPDPLLAPKTVKHINDPDAAGTPVSRAMIAAVVAVALAVGLTIYIVTRKSASAVKPDPSGTPSATTSAAEPHP